MKNRSYRKVKSPLVYITVEPKPCPEDLRDFNRQNYFNAVTVQELWRPESLEVLDLYGGFPVDFFLPQPASIYMRNAAGSTP